MAGKSVSIVMDERLHEGLKRAGVLMGKSFSQIASEFIFQCGQEKYMESHKALKGKTKDVDFVAFHKKQIDAFKGFNDMANEDLEAIEGGE